MLLCCLILRAPVNEGEKGELVEFVGFEKDGNAKNNKASHGYANQKFHLKILSFAAIEGHFLDLALHV